MKRVSVLAFLLLLTVFLAVGCGNVEDGAPGGLGKTTSALGEAKVAVENDLLLRFNSDEELGYLIYFNAEANLAPAYGLSWQERGRYVVRELQRVAEASQARVRRVLDENGVDYKPFWIDNVIEVRSSDYRTFNNLLSFEEISIIRAERTMGLIEPIETAPAKQVGPQTIESNITHVNADDVWGMGYRGEGMVVSNIDTGVRYTHETLDAHYRGNLGDGTYSHDYNWWDPNASNYAYPYDYHGHGSHTMGTMVGEDDTQTNQIGMAPGAKWIACAGCTSSGCAGSALLECAQFIAAPWDRNQANANPDMRPHVVNNSWGDCGTSYDGWYQGVVDAWHAAGIYPVFSNGNASNCSYSSPPGCNTVGNPGRYGNVTGVGSTGQNNGAYATHSNWGPTDRADTVNPNGHPYLKPNVVAPGVSIRSSLSGNDFDYGSWGGTSMSAPHVAGLIALIWQAAECLQGDYARTETLIEETATPIAYTSACGGEGPGAVPNNATGWGEINALAAINAAVLLCGPSGTLEGVVTDATTSEPLAGVTVSINGRTDVTDADGAYSISAVAVGAYTVTASHYAYEDFSLADVSIAEDETTVLDIALTHKPAAQVSGIVRDNSGHNWPLYAKITVTPPEGDPVVLFSDPLSGAYEIELVKDMPVGIQVEAWVSGYSAISQVLTPDSTVYTKDFGMITPDCSAPGYSGAPPCTVDPGGLAIGNVYDANLEEALNDASVSSSGGTQTTSAATTLDPDVDDGFYVLFAPSGDQTLTAAKNLFSDDTALLTVSDDTVVSQDFALESARLEFTPETIEFRVLEGESASGQVLLQNTGNGSAAFELKEARAAAPTRRYALQYEPTSVHYWDESETAPESAKQTILGGWTIGSPVPTGSRYRAAGTTCTGEYLYMFGGQSDSVSYLAESWRYDPAADEWLRLADMPNPSMNMEAECIDGMIYLVGGYANSTHNNYFQVYDTATDTWQNLTWPNARTPVLASYDGKLYAFGGNPGPSNETHVYDPAQDTWTQLTGVPVVINYGAAETVGDYIFVTDNDDATLFRYDPATDSWDTSGPALPEARMSPAMVWYGERVYVVGGGDSGWSPYASILSYDYSQYPGGDWVVNAESMPEPALGIAYACTGQTIMLATGNLQSGNSALPYGFDDGLFCNTASDLEWLSENPLTGTLGGGLEQAISVTVDSSQVPAGLYYAKIKAISQNTPYSAPYVSVAMIVGHQVRVTQSEHGLISPIGESFVEHGGSLELTFTADDGYHVQNVIVDGESLGRIQTLTLEDVTADIEVTALFEFTCTSDEQCTNHMNDCLGTCEGDTCAPSSFKPMGAACGDGSDTACTDPDTCNGVGLCLVNHASTDTVCRDAAGACDVVDYCTGGGACGTDEKSTDVCRESQGVCDPQEVCDGVNDHCPPDAKSTAVCREANGACDVAESCDGLNDDCPTDAFETAGVTCREVAGLCDVSESCSGDSPDCPADGFADDSTVCRTAADVCDLAEFCTGSGVDCPANDFKDESTVCRDVAGACDLPEYCTGVGAGCPTDRFLPASITCRALAGDCDIAEKCTGAAAACPEDAFVSSGEICRDVAGDCDVAETCTGENAACPADAFLPESEICREAKGLCDLDEHCSGIGANCPQDVFKDEDELCREAAGECDIEEYCSGGTPICPTDRFLPTTVTCRQASDLCDAAEHCSGVGVDCPEDANEPDTTVCRDAVGDCDLPDYCTGDSKACPELDAKSTAVCREAAGLCDIEEVCDGIGDDCPPDVFKSSGVLCRESAGECDIEERCEGETPMCPEDAKSSALCREAVGPCDVDEFCDGAADACPIDVVVADETACDDESMCTSSDMCLAGVCQGESTDCNDGIACTLDDCSASDGQCVNTPDDSLCTDDGDPCSAEYCDALEGCASRDSDAWTDCEGDVQDGAFACFDGACEQIAENDTCMSATELALGEATSSSFDLHRAYLAVPDTCLVNGLNGVDAFFSFAAEADERYRVTLTPDGMESDLALVVWNACGDEAVCVAAADDDGAGVAEVVELSADETGELFVQVIRSTPVAVRGVNDFTLLIEIVSSADGDVVADGDGITDGDNTADGDVVADGDDITDGDDTADGDYNIIDGDIPMEDGDETGGGGGGGCSQSGQPWALLMFALFGALWVRKRRRVM